MLEYLLVSFNRSDEVEETTEHISYIIELSDNDKEPLKLINRVIFETQVRKLL